jgi:hypothetical protein
LTLDGPIFVNKSIKKISENTIGSVNIEKWEEEEEKMKKKKMKKF